MNHTPDRHMLLKLVQLVATGFVRDQRDGSVKA